MSYNICLKKLKEKNDFAFAIFNFDTSLLLKL